MNRVKELRLKHNLSQEKLAAILNVHQTAVSQWERNRTSPDKETANKMATMFNVSLSYVLGFDDSAPIENLPFDDETLKALQAAKDRPELQKLLSLGKDATKEDVEKIIEILKVLKGEGFS